MKTKRCTTCKEEYSLEEFHKDKNKKYGRHASCKRCTNLKSKEVYHQKKLIYYSILDAYSDKVCAKCGYTADVWAPFDWHHVDVSTKLYGLASMQHHTEDKIRAELDKCILLCSNCHRLHHYLEE